MRAISLFLLLSSLIFLMACGGTKSLVDTDLGEVPEWFVEAPSDPNFLYAARTATSRDLNLAVDKALTNARAEIARQYEIKVEGLTKSFQEEVGNSEDPEINQMFSQTVRTLISTQLVGSRATKTTHTKDGGNYRAFVLVEQPIGAAHEAFLKNLQTSSNHMYTRFRASEAFKEMDEQLKKYDEWKKEQAQGMMNQ